MAPPVRSIARSLRQRQTEAESRLWGALRDRRFAEWKFRRQHPIAGFVADFACPAAKLVIELDGGQHGDQVDADASRTEKLEANGWTVIRFWNYQLFDDLDAVLIAIEAALPDPRHPDFRK